MQHIIIVGWGMTITAIALVISIVVSRLVFRLIRVKESFVLQPLLMFILWIVLFAIGFSMTKSVFG